MMILVDQIMELIDLDQRFCRIMVLASVLRDVREQFLGSGLPSNGTTPQKMAATDHPETGVRTDPQFWFGMSESTPAGATNGAWGVQKRSKPPKRGSGPLQGVWDRSARTPLEQYRVHAGLASRLTGPDPFWSVLTIF